MRLIDAEALKTALANNTLIRDFNFQFDGIIGEIIDNAPTVIDQSRELVKKSIELGHKVGYFEGKIENKRSQGEWIEDYTETCHSFLGYHCSICNTDALEKNDYPYYSNFCPNCGAKMKGGANDNH